MMKKTFLHRVWIRAVQNIINIFLKGTHCYSLKRTLLRSAGVKIGKGTQIVGPICFDFSEIIIGDNCWIGKDFDINGHGKIIIGNQCGIGPHVRLYTGKHLMGPSEKRHGGQNINTVIEIGDGAMLSAGTSIVGPVKIGKGAVAMVGACVVKDVDQDMLVGGVPAKEIQHIEGE